MVVPIQGPGKQFIEPNKSTRTNSVNNGDFKNAFNTAAAEMYAHVPEALAPYKDIFKKKRLEEESLWNTEEDEEEEPQTMYGVIAQIQERLRKIQMIADDEAKKGGAN